MHSLEPPYPQSMFLRKHKKKKTHNFSPVNYHLTAMKNRSLLHRRVSITQTTLIVKKVQKLQQHVVKLQYIIDYLETYLFGVS